MNPSDPQTRPFTAEQLQTALDAVSGAAQADHLDDILARVRRTRQRPAWTFVEAWLPVSTAASRTGGLPRATILLTLFLLLVGLVVGALLVAGAPKRPPAPFAVTNGVIAFVSGHDIVTVRPDGTGRTVVASGAEDYDTPVFSPDGRHIAYWARTGGAWDLVVADPDGQDPTTVASSVIEPTGAHPEWSPDGTSIAYSARTESQSSCYQNGEFCSSRIFVAATDGSGAHQVGDRQLDARSPAWSPDGSTIAFGAGSADPTIGVRLYLMDPDGTNVRSLSDVRGSDWAFVQIDWSRDGSKLVAQAGAADDITEWDIWVINADGSGATNVGAHDGGDEVIPSWAPDRDALAWWWNGVVLLEDGAQPIDLTSSLGFPSWSPDGQLLMTIDGNNGILKVIDLTGAVRLTIDGVSKPAGWQPIVSDT